MIRPATTSLFEAQPIKHVIDAPLIGRCDSFGKAYFIVTHPAFRIGFLDARQGRPFDHDSIMTRIMAETPKGALERLGWFHLSLLASNEVAIAQYRYEEGRNLAIEHGVTCRAWGHPDFPPAAVMRFCERFRNANPQD